MNCVCTAVPTQHDSQLLISCLINFFASCQSAERSPIYLQDYDTQTRFERVSHATQPRDISPIYNYHTSLTPTFMIMIDQFNSTLKNNPKSVNLMKPKTLFIKVACVFNKNSRDTAELSHILAPFLQKSSRHTKSH